MKLIIDIDEDRYKDVIESQKHHLLDSYAQAVANGIPIPDNATNGDVIKVMFDVEEYHLKTEPDDVFLRFEGEERTIWFSLDWWNSPYQYQKGGKE